MAVRLIKGWWLPLLLSSGMALSWANQTEWCQRLIGKAFPVVTLLTVTHAEPMLVDGQEGVQLSGWAEKNFNAVYQGVYFNLASPFGVPLTARFLDKPKNNAAGILEWDMLVVGIPPDRISEAYGEVKHSFYGLMIRSPFYIGRTE